MPVARRVAVRCTVARLAALSLLVAQAACGSGAGPYDSKLPPPVHHYFRVVVQNETASDLYVDVYLDEVYYPAGFVPAAPPGYPVQFASVSGPYDFMPHKVTINGRLPGAPSVEFTLAKTFYYGLDYGVLTDPFVTALTPVPPPPPTPPPPVAAH